MEENIFYIDTSRLTSFEPVRQLLKRELSSNIDFYDDECFSDMPSLDYL